MKDAEELARPIRSGVSQAEETERTVSEVPGVCGKLTEASVAGARARERLKREGIRETAQVKLCPEGLELRILDFFLGQRRATDREQQVHMLQSSPNGEWSRGPAMETTEMS